MLRLIVLGYLVKVSLIVLFIFQNYVTQKLRNYIDRFVLLNAGIVLLRTSPSI